MYTLKSILKLQFIYFILIPDLAQWLHILSTALFCAANLKPMVRKLLTNGSRTKCTYVWTGLRTCAMPSVNGSHTVRHEPKFVSFLRKHKENWMRRVSFPCTSFLCSPQVRGKLINCAPLTHRMRTAQHVSSALVYTMLNKPLSQHCPCRSLGRPIILSS